MRPRPRELALLIDKLLREEHPAYVLVPHDDDDGPDFCAELNDVTWGLDERLCEPSRSSNPQGSVKFTAFWANDSVGKKKGRRHDNED